MIAKIIWDLANDFEEFISQAKKNIPTKLISIKISRLILQLNNVHSFKCMI